MGSPEKPHFLKIRGCVNCESSKTLKERTGKDYGFDHEIMVACILSGCLNHGFNLTNPSFDPAELVRLANKDGRPELIETVREICLVFEDRFGEFYQQDGISVDEILTELGSESEGDLK